MAKLKNVKKIDLFQAKTDFFPSCWNKKNFFVWVEQNISVVISNQNFKTQCWFEAFSKWNGDSKQRGVPKNAEQQNRKLLEV